MAKIIKKEKISKTDYIIPIIYRFLFSVLINFLSFVQVFAWQCFCLGKVLMNYKMPRYRTVEGREREETLHLMTHLLYGVEYNRVPGSDCQFWEVDKNRIAQSLESKSRALEWRCNRVHSCKSCWRSFILGKKCQ